MTWKTTSVVLGIVAATALASACSAETRSVDLGERSGSSSGFGGGVEAGADAGTDDASTSLLLCATSECPAGTATCETSRSRCDIDLMNDRNNCGACGAACPADDHTIMGVPGLDVQFFCSAGKCEMMCAPKHGDCDGIPDNGCESSLDTRDNCGACGVKCPGDEPCMEGVCGCLPPLINCHGNCVNPKADTWNCGGCDVVCEDPSPAPWDHNYGMMCLAPPGGSAVCTKTCFPGYGDCDEDLEANGCEQRLNSDQHCGACGNACTNGTKCVLSDDTWQCGCPTGQRACFNSNINAHECRDILTDPYNCGACEVLCQHGQEPDSVTPFSAGVCRGGVCDLVCKIGRGDCNGFAGDGCEVDLQTDPRNCGACGNECNLALGQPCVKGECVVAECPEGETK